MAPEESCKLCEKIVVNLESAKTIGMLLEVPNTYDFARGRYLWKEFGTMRYALIPRSVQGRSAQVDFFICMDEDELGELDLLDHAEKFLRTQVFPHWENFRSVRLSEPGLSRPSEIECWKIKETCIE
jgi:hypothetical protein